MKLAATYESLTQCSVYEIHGRVIGQMQEYRVHCPHPPPNKRVDRLGLEEGQPLDITKVLAKASQPPQVSSPPVLSGKQLGPGLEFRADAKDSMMACHLGEDQFE